jgi:hypothetical protein
MQIQLHKNATTPPKVRDVKSRDIIMGAAACSRALSAARQTGLPPPHASPCWCVNECDKSKK